MYIEPKVDELYAIHHGVYAGEMWILCEITDNEYRFLSVPVMENREAEKDKFMFGMNNHIVKRVENIPREVFEVVLKQFRHNETLNN